MVDNSNTFDTFPESPRSLIQHRDSLEEAPTWFEQMSDSQRELFAASMEQVFGDEPVNRSVIENVGNALMWADEETVREFYDHLLGEYHSIVDPKSETQTPTCRNLMSLVNYVGDGKLELPVKKISNDLEVAA